MIGGLTIGSFTVAGSSSTSRASFDANAKLMTSENVDEPSSLTGDLSDSNAIFME